MENRFRPNGNGDSRTLALLAAAAALVLLVVFTPFFLYTAWRIEVPTAHMAVLVKKTGADLPNDEELAPSAEYKGLQAEVLGEGRHFRNPWTWRWDVVPQVEIPQGQIGVRVRLYGEDPPYGEVYVVAVSPAAAGRGLGRALTAAGLRHLAEVEPRLDRVILYVDGDNEPAIRLYEGLGFSRERTEAQYRGPVRHR